MALRPVPTGVPTASDSWEKSRRQSPAAAFFIRCKRNSRYLGEPGTEVRRNDERTGQDRHRRHVPGSAARGSPTQEGGAQLPAVGPGCWAGALAEAKSLTQLPGTGRWRTK